MQIARAFVRSFPVCAAIAVLPVLGSSGCFTDSEGLDPPHDAFYFPTNLVVSPGGKALYVTNSDFDLQYNGGTVQVLDLAKIREKARALVAGLADAAKPVEPPETVDLTKTQKACEAAGLALNGEEVLHPGPCGPLDIAG